MFPNQKNYSVVQSTFDTPCRPAPHAFYSGFVESSLSGPLAPIHFTITLNDSNPIWFYCSQDNDCQHNMVGVINPYVVFYFGWYFEAKNTPSRLLLPVLKH